MKKKLLRLSPMVIILAVIACLLLMVVQGKHALLPAADTPVTEGKAAAGSGRSTTVDHTASGVDSTGDSPSKAAGRVQSGSVHPASAVNAKTVRINDKEYPLRTYKPMAVPNDPSAAQWWVTQSKLDRSWDIPVGSSQTTLAIIDSGFALGHEEFKNRWYANTGESGAVSSEAASALNCADRGLALSAACNLIDDDSDGTVDNETGVATYQNPSRLNCTAQSMPLDKSCNRIDDDLNGYVDDISGWDFTSNDNAPQAGELNAAGDGTTHGTKVAGIAAATGNNSKGIAGVDWQTKILPIQALDDDSYGDTLSVGRAIYYAIGQGADVISISLGSDLPDNYVREAVQAALAKGIVVVAAAGNDGCDCIVFPANYPEVVAVGALNSSGQAASFSSYGQNLDIMAPGTNMTSPTWQTGNRTSAYASGLNGTSFAAPLVGGLLTRLKSFQPTASPAQLIAALTENVNRLGLVAAAPLDPHYGFGTVDAYASASRMTTPRTGQLPYAFTPVSKGNTLNPSSPAEPVNGGLVYVCNSGGVASTAIYELTKGGAHFFTLSKVENQKAVDAGYTSALLAYACLGEPHDSNTVMHSLNIFHEFRNKYPKQP